MRRFLANTCLIRLPFIYLLAWLAMASVTPSCAAPYFMVAVAGWAGYIAVASSVMLVTSLMVDLMIDVLHFGNRALVMIHRYRFMLFLSGAMSFLIPIFTYSQVVELSWPTGMFYTGMIIWGVCLAIHDVRQKVASYAMA